MLPRKWLGSTGEGRDKVQVQQLPVYDAASPSHECDPAGLHLDRLHHAVPLLPRHQGPVQGAKPVDQVDTVPVDVGDLDSDGELRPDGDGPGVGREAGELEAGRQHHVHLGRRRLDFLARLHILVDELDLADGGSTSSRLMPSVMSSSCRPWLAMAV